MVCWAGSGSHEEGTDRAWIYIKSGELLYTHEVLADSIA